MIAVYGRTPQAIRGPRLYSRARRLAGLPARPGGALTVTAGRLPRAGAARACRGPARCAPGRACAKRPRKFAPRQCDDIECHRIAIRNRDEELARESSLARGHTGIASRDLHLRGYPRVLCELCQCESRSKKTQLLSAGGTTVRFAAPGIPITVASCAKLHNTRRARGTNPGFCLALRDPLCG